MAQLKDTTIDGKLETTNSIYIPNTYGLIGHNAAGEARTLIHHNSSNNTLVGFGGYNAGEGHTYICGNDIYILTKLDGAAADGIQYKPYYNIGEAISNVKIRTAGYCSNNGTIIRFCIHLSKPVIGNPKVVLTSTSGYKFVQNGKYTHGSAVDFYITEDNTSMQINASIIAQNYIDVEVVFKNPEPENAITLDAIGVLWIGDITFEESSS